MTKGKTKFELSREKREQLISEIQHYFLKERDEELGNLAAAMILDFFMEKIALHFYNQGIEDAYQFISEKLEDLHGLHKS